MTWCRALMRSARKTMARSNRSSSAAASAAPVAADDAAEARLIGLAQLRAWLGDSPPADALPLAFDHAQILRDYLIFRDTGRRPRPVHRQG